ncbi:MAG: hypothetical protein Q8L74_13030 [Nitrospirota bacterium]|nr:hypothetical protein [Nitrospirota bacterium]
MRIVSCITICLVLVSQPVFAQTVSVLTSGNSTESMLVEAAVKRYLRAEGYTVKGGTIDGYLVLVNVMANNTVSGVKRGVVGSVMVASVGWQDVANSVLTAGCQEENIIAQKLEDMLGTRMILIESTIAQAGDEESVAELFSTFANREIRKSSRKVTEFFNEVERRTREVPLQGDVQMR